MKHREKSEIWPDFLPILSPVLVGLVFLLLTFDATAGGSRLIADYLSPCPDKAYQEEQSAFQAEQRRHNRTMELEMHRQRMRQQWQQMEDRQREFRLRTP